MPKEYIFSHKALIAFVHRALVKLHLDSCPSCGVLFSASDFIDEGDISEFIKKEKVPAQTWLDLPNCEGWWWYSKPTPTPICIANIKKDAEYLTFDIIHGDEITHYWDYEHRLTGKWCKAIVPEYKEASK